MANLPFFSDLHRRWPTWTPECWQPNAIAGQKKKDEMSVSPHGRRLDKGQRSKIIDTYGGVSFIIVGIKLPTAFKLFKVESAGVPCSDPLSDPLFRSLVPIPCSDPLFRSLVPIPCSDPLHISTAYAPHLSFRLQPSASFALLPRYPVH
jgi:hypothetical protein